MKFKKLFCLFIVTVLAGTGAYAENPAPVTLTVHNAECELSSSGVALDISVDDPAAIIGASFTVQYDVNHLALKSVDSTFFDSFENQFQAAGATNTPPVNVTVGDTTYNRPLVLGDESLTIGGTRIAAVRARSGEKQNQTLFTLHFDVKNPEYGDSYSVGIVPTVITNEVAGYSGEGEAIPMLITQVAARAFPEIGVNQIIPGTVTVVDTSERLVSGTLMFDGEPVPNTEVEITAALTGTTYTTVTDGEGHFEITVSDSVADAGFGIRFGSGDYGNFQSTFSVADGTIAADFTNYPPEKPVLLAVTEPVGLTPAFETEAFSDDNNGHWETEWQIVDKTKIEDMEWSLDDLVDEDGSITDDSVLVYRTKGDHCLTDLIVPGYFLNADTTYCVRARFYDDCPAGNMVSPWSDFVEFQTKADPEGFIWSDGVLVPEEQALSEAELAAFEEVVIGVKSADPTVNMGIPHPENATLGCLSTCSVEDLGDDALAAMPEDVDMPYGVMGFNLDLDGNDPSENVVTVSIYFDVPIPADMTWWKYDECENLWTDYTEHATFADDRLSVELELKDGGFGDSDRLENGRIVDPGGLGTAVSDDTSGDADDGTSGDTGDDTSGDASADTSDTSGSSDGSCFIGTMSCSKAVSTHVSDRWFVYTIGAFILVSGVLVCRRKKINH